MSLDSLEQRIPDHARDLRINLGVIASSTALTPVSAITGCEACVRAHEKAVRERGVTMEAVHDSVRIAAVIHGISIALSGADVRTGGGTP